VAAINHSNPGTSPCRFPAGLAAQEEGCKQPAPPEGQCRWTGGHWVCGAGRCRNTVVSQRRG